MKIKFVWLLCLTFLLSSAFAATPVTPTITGPKVNVTMRDNGYTLGDTIAMQAEFNLAKGLVFDPNSVPLKGPVNNWLDLRDATMMESKNLDDSSYIRIDFTWQIFGTVEHAQMLKIPAIALQTLAPTTGNTKPLTITIPAQGFNLSPVLPPTITEKKHRPHAPPLSFDTRTPLTIGLLCLGLSLLCGTLWLWLMDKIVWWPRNPGPITQLNRQLNKTGVLNKTDIAQQTNFSPAHLRAIHKALAESAGQSLYPNTLDHLFENAPYLAQEKPAITQFFNATWQQFFTNNHQAIQVKDTLAWVKRAAIAERLFRASQDKVKNKRTVLNKTIVNKAAKA